MKTKFFALMIVWAFALNAVGTTFAAPETGEAARQDNQLVNLLPASDGVMTLNIQRLFGDALPQILSGNQPILSEIVGTIDEVKAKTGFDLRQFEQVAVGVSNKRIAAREMAFEPVLLARGAFNANALLALGKIAARQGNFKYREEKIGERTIYIFTPQTPPIVIKTAPLPNQPAAKPRSAISKAIDKMFEGLSREFAVAAFDDNTLAIGSTARVRETFAATPRLSGEILDSVNRKPNAIVNFGLKMPNGLSNFVNLGNDELGKNLDAIRYLSGAMDVSDGSAVVSVLAKTLKPEQAKGLQESLEGFQMLGKAFIGGAKSADKQVYARMIDNLKIARSADEVTLDLQVPQSDIKILLDNLSVKMKVDTVSAH